MVETLGYLALSLAALLCLVAIWIGDDGELFGEEPSHDQKYIDR